MAAQVESTLASLLAEGPLDGLILDLRLNVGGRNLGVQTILGHFVDGQVGYAEDTFEGRPRRNPIVVDTSPLGDQLRDVPLAVLVDPGTNSNAEVLAAVLQQQRAAFVVGTPTAGNVESVYTYIMDDGSILWLARTRTILAGGLNLEGTGVIPDLPVDADWTQYLFADDPYLLAAVASLIESNQQLTG
ncbi:MAG: carboxyl-terminal processing protease [Thermomicrobiales bacterium]|jgi:C-terminal processing protease CtpA/Prc|nr:carboxyl-terminal processing protease [Thermomicrobiales bacterium]